MRPRLAVAVPLVVAAGALVAGGPAAGQEAGEAATPKPPATAPVTKGPFAPVLELAGVFDSRSPVEVSYDPLLYGGDLEVVEAAEAGPVTQGQVLVRFKTEKIDEQIRDAEMALALARKGFERQSEDAKRAEEATAIALARSEADARNAEQALKTFEEIERPLRLRESDLGLQFTRDSIEDQTEELEQLEKMYRADDLVEETEDIVLKRARRSLQRTRTRLTFQETRDGILRQITLPRDLENLKLNQRQTANDRARTLVTAPLAFEQSRLEFEKARAALAKQTENLEKLRKDREALTVTAPAAGYAVPGTLARGRWSGIDDLARTLRPSGKARAEQVLFTIVQPGDVLVRTSVAEASLFLVAEGQEAKVTPNAAKEHVLPARVSRVARVSTGSEYEVLLDLAEGDPRLMPGHNCKLKLTTSERPEALTVPAEAVEADGDKRFVHVWADGKATRREVATGATSGGRTEILSGAAEGERVLATAPKGK